MFFFLVISFGIVEQQRKNNFRIKMSNVTSASSLTCSKNVMRHRCKTSLFGATRKNAYGYWFQEHKNKGVILT